MSIVTPSLNQGRFIRDAIESVLGQDYPSIEYIIVDGGSSDETASVVEEYSDRVRFISEPDRGQSDAINKGWRLATGEIVSWLCADDMLLPGAVSTVVAEFAATPEAALVYGESETVDVEGHHLATSEVGAPDLWRLIHGFDYIIQPAAFARRSIVDGIGGVDEHLRWGMDWDLFIRIGRCAPMRHVSRLLAQVREYDETKTLSGGFTRFRELVGIMRRYSDARYPPAFFYYGLGTIQQAIKVGLAQRTGFIGVLTRPAARGLDGVCEWGLDRAITAARRGWHPDGWASPVVDHVLAGDASRVRISGRVPDEYPELRGQVLSLSIGSVSLGQHPVGPGEFDLDVPIPPDAGSRDERVLRIRSSRHFVPRRSAINGDRRRLSFYLDRLC